MKLALSLSDETREILEELADTDGIEPAKRIHQWMRKFAFDPPFQGGASWTAQASALSQRGTMRFGDRMLSVEELNTSTAHFAMPNGRTDDTPLKSDEVEIVFGKRIEDAFPKCLAFMDITTAPEQKRMREWHDSVGFLQVYVSAKCAEEKSKNDAREVEEEEATLYPGDKKKKKAEKKD